jgi:hypothetical protein
MKTAARKQLVAVTAPKRLALQSQREPNYYLMQCDVRCANGAHM